MSHCDAKKLYLSLKVLFNVFLSMVHTKIAHVVVMIEDKRYSGQTGHKNNQTISICEKEGQKFGTVTEGTIKNKTG